MPYPRKMPQIEVYLILISDGRLMDGFRTDKHLSQTVGWGAVHNYDDFLTIGGSLKTYLALQFLVASGMWRSVCYSAIHWIFHVGIVES